MLFNSYIFILLFLPTAAIGYYILNHFKKYQAAMWFVTVMSLWFYGYLNSKYLVLLLASIGVNYLLTMAFFRIAKDSARKMLFATGLIFHIGTLFYFKYYNFFVENLNKAFGSEFTLIHVILPLGISFLAFRQIAYLVDAYLGKIPKYTLCEYTSYVTFFPVLSQGPIVLHEEFIPQLQDISKKTADYEKLFKGIYAFALGLAKKVLLADTLAKFVSVGFLGNAGTDAVNTFVAMLCFALQLYFDFSGYCDMASGIGLLFNLELPINFNSPYKAANISEFWNRWHITLTHFFTRYIYIPLGGSRKGMTRTSINTMIVFLVSGLWHGANWTFVLWGALHGILLVTYKIGKKVFDKIPRVIGVFVTFFIVIFLWTIFRADTVREAITMLRNVLSGQLAPISSVYTEAMNTLVEMRILARFGLQSVMDDFAFVPMMILIFGALFGVFVMKNTQEKVKKLKMNIQKVMVMVVLLTWSILSLAEISSFLYVNF